MTEAHIHPLARYIDHTLLKPQTRGQEIERLCGEARRFGFYGVCVNGRWVPLCRELLAGSGVAISAVVGFPLGAAHPLVKALEAERAVRDGAGEIDMVISTDNGARSRTTFAASAMRSAARRSSR